MDNPLQPGADEVTATDSGAIASWKLLRDIDSGRIREFEPAHAERLLKYPGTRWEEAPPGSIASPLPPRLTKPEPSGCYCQRETHADSLEELCTNCPVVATINNPKAAWHIREEIRLNKELLLPEQYKHYCSEALKHHAVLVGRLATEWPWSVSNMEALFHNKGVVKLYRQELEKPAEPTPKGSTLTQNAGSTVADCWDGIFENYTLTDLNNLLVYVGLLETAEPLVVADNTRPGQWVAVVAALKKARKTRASRAALARAFIETYGGDACSQSSLQKQFKEENEDFNLYYTRALSRLGQR